MSKCSNVQPYLQSFSAMIARHVDDSFRRQTGYNQTSRWIGDHGEKVHNLGDFETVLHGLSLAYTGTQNTHKPLAGGSIPPVGTNPESPRR